MAKVFYTEHDIEDMVKRGERSLMVTESVVLTDLAFERARKLGVELLQPHDTPPGAPIRPYLNQKTQEKAGFQLSSFKSSKVDLIKQRVKSAVKARLGSQVDDSVLDKIIERVASELGLK